MNYLVILIDLSIFSVATFFLVKASEILIHAFNELSRSNKVELFALVSFFSIIITSLPELIISTSSALVGHSEIALGIVLGANITSITLVIGIITIFGGGLSVVADFVEQDVSKAFAAIILPIIFLIDGKLSTLDGILLLLTFILYHITIFSKQRKYHHRDSSHPFTNIGKYLHQFDHHYNNNQWGWVILGVMILLFSSDMIVQSSTRLSLELGIPLILMGMLLISFATSLPEMVFELKAASQKKTSLIFGDLLGSLVINSTLVLGVATIIQPITLTQNSMYVFMGMLVFILAFFLMWIFMKTKFRLEKWEGAVLLCVYLISVLVIITNLLLN